MPSLVHNGSSDLAPPPGSAWVHTPPQGKRASKRSVVRSSFTSSNSIPPPAPEPTFEAAGSPRIHAYRRFDPRRDPCPSEMASPPLPPIGHKELDLAIAACVGLEAPAVGIGLGWAQPSRLTRLLDEQAPPDWRALVDSARFRAWLLRDPHLAAAFASARYDHIGTIVNLFARANVARRPDLADAPPQWPPQWPTRPPSPRKTSSGKGRPQAPGNCLEEMHAAAAGSRSPRGAVRAAASKRPKALGSAPLPSYMRPTKASQANRAQGAASKGAPRTEGSDGSSGRRTPRSP
mmetsp:Transcript_26729/g.59793  ORF Transcript_26729/g.59793 Transcript_26729/m.59793 type:complete len:291 (-) Transcript_26729:180-1052(-)